MTTRRTDARAQRRTRQGKPAAASDTLVTGASGGTRWLLLIHQIPPKPDYLRVKIGRRLAHVGAVAIKNSVYVLPPRAESYEDFQWIVREIEEAGGDAFVSEASLGEGLTDAAVHALFDAARNLEYSAILADAKALLKSVHASGRASKRSGRPSDIALEHELAKLRRRYEAASAIDFFGASGQGAVSAALRDIQQQRPRDDAAPRERGTTDGHGRAPTSGGRVWITRRDVHVDRIASAWLIRRFIDPRARFRFVDPERYRHGARELRFDMYEGEYTHVGDACTFETLVTTFVPNDPPLHEIAEIVHDVDCKDGKFGRDEAPGVAKLIAGIAAANDRDEDRIQRGAAMFDDLYAALDTGLKSRTPRQRPRSKKGGRL